MTHMTLMCDSLGTKAKEVRWVSLFTQLFLCIQSREVDMGFVWWWWCWCWLVFIFSFLCQIANISSTAILYYLNVCLEW